MKKYHDFIDNPSPILNLFSKFIRYLNKNILLPFCICLEET